MRCTSVRVRCSVLFRNPIMIEREKASRETEGTDASQIWSTQACQQEVVLEGWCVAVSSFGTTCPDLSFGHRRPKRCKCEVTNGIVEEQTTGPREQRSCLLTAGGSQCLVR